MSSSDESQNSERGYHPRDINDEPNMQHESPRRHSIAIQDILNPTNNDMVNSSSDQGSPPSGNPRRPASRRSSNGPGSRRPSTSPAANGRRRMSISSNGPRERRQFRPTYSDEEVLFIWYYRIDLGCDWQVIANAYNAQFPERPRDGFGGIQCKYYRYCEEFGIPKVRNRDRSPSAVQRYGMRYRTGRSYPWMRS